MKIVRSFILEASIVFTVLNPFDLYYVLVANLLVAFHVLICYVMHLQCLVCERIKLEILISVIDLEIAFKMAIRELKIVRIYGFLILSSFK